MNNASSPPVQSEDNVEVSVEEKPIQPEPPLPEESVTKPPPVSNDVSLDVHAEGDDGWQPVQRPRSAGLVGKRPRQRRQHGSKIFNHQKKDFNAELDHARLKNNHQSSKYYVLKKRATAEGSVAEFYVAKSPSSGSKFGRKVVKTVAYRVKSVSSSSTDAAVGNSKNEGEPLSSPSDPGPVSAQKEVGAITKRSSIVSLGKSPSYKEVALAPPGTISMLQARVPHDDVPEEQHKEAKEKSVSTVENAENDDKASIEDLVVEPTSQLKDENEALDKKEGIHLDSPKNDENLVVVSEDMEPVQSSHNESNQIEELGINDDNVPIYAYSSEMATSAQVSLSPKESNDNEKSILQGVEETKDKPSMAGPNDSREVSIKKLSASAAPYNPSVVSPRMAPLPMNISHPPGPGVVPPNGPWPMNMGLHPGHATMLPSPISSSHRLYPSPPATPNIIHPLPFMYPPYSQAQSMPPSNFQITNNPFHPSQFAWQCNIRVNTPEYPGAVWPGCHPMDFPSPTVVESIPKHVSEAKENSISSEHLSLAPDLPVYLDTGNEPKKEIDLPASEAVEDLTDITVVQSGNREEISDSNLHGVPFPDNLLNGSNGPNAEAHRCNEYQVQRQQPKSDSEKTFNILFKGRRNRKQMLRMPISLLKKPYTSQAFKVVYSRVVRETELPRSMSFDSKETSTLDAT